MTLAPAREPPRPRSPAQREAARRNGARSKDPVTAEGRARSARNALRHGLCSPAILFPGADPARFEALRAALEAEYAPGSPSARLLVERLAVTVRKLARCDRLEARLATIEPHYPTGRLFPDPGLPRILSPELATLLRWQAQLDRQLHRLTKSLAEHARFASPGEHPAPAEDGPAADGEPEPPATAPGEALFRPPEAASARDTDEAVEPDDTTGCADPPNEPDAAPHPVAFGLAMRPALSATAPGCAAPAPQNGPNEPEAEGERVAAPAAAPGWRASLDGGTGRAEPGVRVAGAGPGPDASANLQNEPEPATPAAGPFARAPVPPGPAPEALLARGDLRGLLRARKARERPGPPHPTPPCHPHAREEPGP